MPLRRVLSGLSNFVLSTFSDVGSIPLARGGSNFKSGTRFYALTRIEKVRLEEVRLRRSSDVGRRSRDLFGTVKGLTSPYLPHLISGFTSLSHGPQFQGRALPKRPLTRTKINYPSRSQTRLKTGRGEYSYSQILGSSSVHR